MVVDMESKLRKWQQKLLDLGKRNPNLNFKFNKSSNLKIEKPNIYSLWHEFVDNAKEQSFGVDLNKSSNPFFSETANKVEADDISYTDDSFEENAEVFDEEQFKPKKNIRVDLYTNHKPAEQFKILRNLKKKAQQFKEEQGINVLFLCFGFLRYSEGNDYYEAPLVLVPAAIKNESVFAPYILEPSEDDIVLNPTLCYKMENDFGIILPEFDENEDLSCYFKEVQKKLKGNYWLVNDNVGLAILSFNKISMYTDLKLHKDGIVEHELVRTIGGDTEVSIPNPPDLSGGIDNCELLKPENCFQVVDADSSQQKAIICAKKGVSFVLQGPPGTGKSQTITNIIAECLGDGKKVLFVSEKMAALEVVHKRLKDAQLDDFCLIMHSHKANKKSIMNQFESVLKLADKKLSLTSDAYEKLGRLEEDKETLNSYSETIFKNIEPLNTTVFAVNGQLAELQECPDLVFAIEDVRHISNQQLSTMHSIIRKFTRCLENTKGDISNNPWYGCTISYVGHEVSQNIEVYFKKLISKFDNFSGVRDVISKNIFYNFSDTYSGITDAHKILEVALRAKKVPANWILGTYLEPFNAEIVACKETKSKFQEIRKRIQELHTHLKAADSSLDFSDYSVLENSEFIQAHKYYIANVISQDTLYATLSSESDLSVLDQRLSFLKTNISELQQIRASLNSKFEKDIYTIPCNEILTRFKTEYSWGFFNFLKSSYRNDKKLFKGLLKTVGQSISDDEIVAALASLKRIDEIVDAIKSQEDALKKVFGVFYQAENSDVNSIETKIGVYKLIQTCLQELARLEVVVDANEARENDLKAHYETLYSGIETDWDMVRESLDWAESFKAVFSQAQDNKEFVDFVCANNDTTGKIKSAYDLLSNWINDIAENYKWLKSNFDGSEDFDNISLAVVISRLKDCCENMSLLELWIDYRDAKSECCSNGLSDFVRAVEESDIQVAHITPAFDKRFYKLWLDKIIPENESLANFRGDTHNWIVSEFKNLDRQQLNIAKARIRSELVNRLPAFDTMTSGKDEIAILRREMNKQRRIMPIRKLFASIPNLIMLLKPCLMMSPLTVSLFLESDSFKFDTIIFDEASQVCTENAIGAIFRGKQVIIAGDSKQLPPTNFFHAALQNSDYDEYDEDDETNNDVFESLLDEAALLPSKTLLWHYRSRHEHLIAFSNAKIYNNNLITFPTNKENGSDLGVEYVHVPTGFYDRGGRKGNVIEAARIADLVFEHFEKCKKGEFNRSLGVITFGEVQALAVETALRAKRQAQPEYEEFFNEELEEPFFVKSLENVQGDERDTIIFSIGYAKDKNGVMHMAFGPLSQTGGERRLNVAITRAKYNIKLVGSILPTDIDVDRVSSDGPKLLRFYIDFALRGIKALDSEITDDDILKFDSPFEESVYNVLSKAGYKVKTQVGCSGYRIDLGVQHPDIPGTYVLGVECDGASYHSAKTARERDRLRQDVLENMGWKIYRIWSTDWIKDPISEGRKLVEAVKSAVHSYGKSSGRSKLSDGPMIAPENLVEEEEKEELYGNIPGFDDFEAPEYSPNPSDNIPYNDIKRKLVRMINDSYPIHQDFLYQECCYYYDKIKVTAAVKNNVDGVLRSLVNSGKVVQRGAFYYPCQYESVPVRTAGVRKIEQISSDELSGGMYLVAQRTIGISFDGLLQETASAFGFKRRGPKITAALEDAYKILESSGKLSNENEKIIVHL